MQEMKVVVFKIGEEFYGLDIGIVLGIENYMNIINTPNSPDYIKGIINLRGEVIPVYNLRAKFKKTNATSSESNKFVIVKVEDNTIALEVDLVENIKNIEEDKFFDPPIIIKSKDTQYVEKIINVEGILVVLLNPNKLLSEDVKMQLKEMMNVAKDA